MPLAGAGWRGVLAAAFLLLLTGASVDRRWQWGLPDGMAPPPVPADNPMSAAKVALGRRLFYEADLSIDGTMSCATCHGQRSGFTDGATTHAGVHGDPGLRNVPSLINVAWKNPLNLADPHMILLEQQAMVPILGDDPVEMGMKGQERGAARRLKRNPCYRRLFRAAFPQEKGRIAMETIGKALAAYQRTIISFDTPWDRARAGGAPLPEAARRGEALFNGKAGCVSCHGGVNFTDNRLHPALSSERDSGVMRATGRPQDKGLFRTPGLRHVALTAPYWHDGHIRTLDGAIAAHDLPPDIAPDAEERADIIAFLGQLSDPAITRDPRFAVPPEQCEINA
ncbi:MAG: cytochrome-c peroxidase [Sphingobium sp.]